MLCVLALAGLSCVLGLVTSPPAGPEIGGRQEVLDMIRIVAGAALAITLVLGPGLLWRAASGRRLRLAFVPVPGIALLVVTACLAWGLAHHVEPRVVCFAVFAPLLGLMLGALLGMGAETILEPEERGALLIVGCALGFAVARSLWSLGPEGELYGGHVTRTLEVGDRSDSRIPYLISQLVAHGTRPYSPLGSSYFAPYDFSTRGPLPGLASAPIILMAGGRPPLAVPEGAWVPFDPAGFMAFRLAMMTLASTAFLSIWGLVRHLGGQRPARIALLLAVTTPFLVHEVWFTWPKLFAASFVILAGLSIVERKAFRSGLQVGIGYLMHPGAVLSPSGIGLLALWPLQGANWRRPDWKAALLLIVGAAVSLLAWRLVNGSHYSQSGFVEYLTGAGTNYHAAPGEWLAWRAASLGNTLVPMMLPIFFAKSFTVNVVGGASPAAVHFFFQYWNTLPFGIGILFFPLLLASLWRAWRLWRWPVFAAVIAPFAAFTIYWGASRTGMLREGLQAWVLVLLAVVALQQTRAGLARIRSKPIRAILALRVVELLLVALGPALATRHVLVSPGFALTDVVALVAMVAFAAILAKLVWSIAAEPAQPRTVSEGRSPALTL
jgi:hypothetical protein